MKTLIAGLLIATAIASQALAQDKVVKIGTEAASSPLSSAGHTAAPSAVPRRAHG